MFWSLTPRRLAQYFLAARIRDDREFNDQMTIAYLASVTPHMKKPLPLRDLLRGPSRPPAHKQGWQEMKAALQIALAG